MDAYNHFEILAALDEDLEDEDIQIALAFLAGVIPAEGNDVYPAGNLVDVNPLNFVVANNIAAVADHAIVEDPENPWKVVVRPQRVMNNNAAEPDVPQPPMEACELVYLWEPKVGSLRQIRKWSMARRSGCYMTRRGLASFVY